MLNKIKYTLLSMLTVFKHLFKRPVTLEYPEKRKVIGEHFRGKPVVKNCIKCRTCQKVCPSGAITITDDKFTINLKKCIFCGNCSFYCPVKAINMTEDYELATSNDRDLELVYNLEEADERNN